MDKNTPILTSALICEQVITDNTGKHNLIGVFTNINATDFPAIHPHMTLFCAWLNREQNETYKLKISLIDPQKNELAKIDGEIEFKRDKSITFGIFNFNGVKFEEEGRHIFEIYLGDKKIVEIPIRIKRAETESTSKPH